MMTNNHYTLKGKCVLICGGLGWLGSHYSKSIVENGGSLIILDYDTIDNYSDFFSKDNLSNIESHVVDFYDHLLFENKLKTIFDNNKIDCIINNAFDFSGNTGFDKKKDFTESLVSHWEKTSDSGLIWPLLSTQQFIKQKKVTEKIKIINIASMYALVAPDPKNYKGTDSFMLPQYGMVKSAIINLTKYLASYYGSKGVIANCIAPGAFPKQDKMKKDFGDKLIKNIPLGRIGRPQDLIGVMLFLISDDSNYITGQTIVVDGGWTIR